MHIVKRLRATVIALGVLASTSASAAYSQLYVFGDSLSDTGNNALLFGSTRTPDAAITGNDFVAVAPYTSGRYSNGPVWADVFSQQTGFGVLLPSLLGGNNYAFGGARSSDPSPLPSLSAQVDAFIAKPGAAPSDALYVVAGGGNNVRDTATAYAAALAAGTDPSAIIPTAVGGFVTDILSIVGKLKLEGAQKIIVWDTPDLGLTPAANAAGPAGAALLNDISRAMNAAMFTALAGSSGVEIFDVFGLLDRVAADPGQFGLLNVSDACIGGACDTATQLFWDGIHPTATGHSVIAQAMVKAAGLPEPGSLLLVAMSLALLAGTLRQSRAPRG